MSKDTQEVASTHTLLQQMLNPLIDNQDATPTMATLFPEVTTDMPQVDEEEEETQHHPPPAPTKEWIETIYTFQDVQSQANLCTWIGELQKQGLRLIDIRDVRTLTKFMSKSMW